MYSWFLISIFFLMLFILINYWSWLIFKTSKKQKYLVGVTKNKSQILSEMTHRHFLFFRLTFYTMPKYRWESCILVSTRYSQNILIRSSVGLILMKSWNRLRSNCRRFSSLSSGRPNIHFNQSPMSLEWFLYYIYISLNFGFFSTMIEENEISNHVYSAKVQTVRTHLLLLYFFFIKS